VTFGSGGSITFINATGVQNSSNQNIGITNILFTTVSSSTITSLG
jgi:hypothetical protein